MDTWVYRVQGLGFRFSGSLQGDRLACAAQGLRWHTGVARTTFLRAGVCAVGLGRVQDIGWEVPPYTNSPKYNIIGGVTIIPIRDCGFQGEHPKKKGSGTP